MAELVSQPALQQVGRPLSLIPVGLKEAALDSPTFRATAVHFSDQVEIIEKWLDAYLKSASKLIHDVSSLEETINTFITRSSPPANVSEAVLDHDFTLLAMKRNGDGSHEWWSQVIAGIKKMDTIVVEPLRAFMSGELRNFKDARRYLEQSQKNFDNTLARYLGQSKTKEPSALREDAFQVHESRKAYLKASLDFCLLAPQLRSTIDKLFIRVSSDQWREMKRARDTSSTDYAKWSSEMDRLRGWAKEMEAGENVFRRELQVARRDIAEAVNAASQPSRELEDYNVSTVAFIGSKGPSAIKPLQTQGKAAMERSEKQGWLYLRTISGKPGRTFWVRRWFYVKNGIFGWLVQGTQSGGVEESEKIGVLLCNVKPAVGEDRRFCFEVKTKNTTILLQAETQIQLMEWLEIFETAKNRALEASAKDISSSYPGWVDPAFAITPPLIPEFAATEASGNGNEELLGGLSVPGDGLLSSRTSLDIGSGARRSMTSREDGDSGREHAARIIQKLDLRKPIGISEATGPVGGIASLISASHTILPGYSAPAISQTGLNTPVRTTIGGASSTKDAQPSTLAPATLANPPAPTNLSKAAVIASGERGVGLGRSDATGGMPSGIMANLWGSSNWGYINRLERGEIVKSGHTGSVAPLSPASRPVDENDHKGLPSAVVASISTSTDPSANTSTPTLHRKAISVDAEATLKQSLHVPQPDVFPPNYPLELKTQEAQFRMLFPNVPREEKLVLVFQATWNPNDQQEFPGRVYITPKTIYFYSHHLGLVLISGMNFSSIEEVTAAPGRDCDFIFLHIREGVSMAAYRRVTIKTFLEPLRLLHSRLNYLIDNQPGDNESPIPLEKTINALLKLENEDQARSPSIESWEDVSANTPFDDNTVHGRHKPRDIRAVIHVEKGLQLGKHGKEVSKFQLPSAPIIYEPPDMDRKATERQFNISSKALFHVLFGDKSTVFQVLYHERRAQRIAQSPWIHLDEGHMRREFTFQIDHVDLLRRHRQVNFIDYQVIDILNDHVCYLVTDTKTPWHLPHYDDFKLVTKIVITHVAKSKCKLSIYIKVQWSKAPTFSKGLVERQALDDLELDAADLGDVVAEQVRKLGPHSRTKKAVQIFGHVGKQTTVSLFSGTESGRSKRPQIKQRGLTSMLFETTSSLTESVASTLMLWTFALLKKIWNISSAHSLLLSLLALSALANTFFAGRESSEWWNERDAVRFMSRLGVGPNLMMSKAIYLKDLDDAVLTGRHDILGGMSTSSESRWYVSETILFRWLSYLPCALVF